MERAGAAGSCLLKPPMSNTFSALADVPEVIQNTEAAVSTRPRRVVELDVLRGFLLLWMTLTHLPTKVSFFSNQAFGLVSAAEGFICLAGFMVGQIEFRAESKGGEGNTIRDLLKRSSRIYLYHCGMLAIAFTIVAEFGIRYHRLALENLLSFYMQSPKEAAAAAGLLIYRPSLFDILPMYIVFMLITPLCRRVANRWGWKLVIFLSACVWAAAQLGFRNWFYDHVNLFGLAVPRDSTGAFDMWGWQFLWIVGLAAGTAIAARKAPLVLSRSLLVSGCVIALAFFVLRHSSIDQAFNADLYGRLVDKWHLGPLRLINFAALVVVLIRFGPAIGRSRIMQPLAALGQTSLEVFCVHVLCCLVAVSLNEDADPMLEPWQQIIILFVTLAALFITPQIRNAWKRQTALKRAAA